MTKKPSYQELEKTVKELKKELLKKEGLEERLHFLSLAVEQSSEGIAISDLEGNLEYVNNAFAYKHGYSPDELIGKNLSIFHTLQQMPSVKQANKQIKKTGAFKGEIWHLRHDGTLFPGLMHNSLIKDEKNKPIGMMATLRDISDIKQAEGSLRKKTHDLGERVKELNCLYGISKIRERNDIAFEEMLQEIVDLIPSSWQYPEITCARIIIEGQEYKTKNFKETVWKQASNIVVHGKRIGILEVCYLEEKPESDEGPFVKEERRLIGAIAERLERVTEYKQAEEELRIAHDKLECRV
ncbi:MAG: PAS domain S-box protein [Desulfobacterales bacterium]